MKSPKRGKSWRLGWFGERNVDVVLFGLGQLGKARKKLADEVSGKVSFLPEYNLLSFIKRDTTSHTANSQNGR